MEFKDFEIGKTFFSGPESDLEWKVTDIGTRRVIARRITDSTKALLDDEDDNIVFYSYDFGGCSLKNSDIV